jgi:hypothetical protein
MLVRDVSMIKIMDTILASIKLTEQLPIPRESFMEPHLLMRTLLLDQLSRMPSTLFLLLMEM